MLLTSENRIKSFKLTFASSLPRKPASNQITSIIGACCTEKKNNLQVMDPLFMKNDISLLVQRHKGLHISGMLPSSHTKICTDRPSTNKLGLP